MPRKKQQSNLIRGYSAWSKKKLIHQAVNVARWNPWLAHKWMEEAIDGLSIMDDLEFEIIEAHDKAADIINSAWRALPSYRYHNPKTFWNEMPPKMIGKVVSDTEYDVIETEKE